MSLGYLITGRNEVVAMVIFLHLSAILFTGGGFCFNACWDTNPPGPGRPALGPDSPGPGRPPPPDQADPPGTRPPRTRQTPPGPDPPDQADPPGTRPPPPHCILQYTVYERPVRILLECILVYEVSIQTGLPRIFIQF